MIKVVFLDIDNTLLSFSEYVREAMQEGFAKFGLKPYEDYMLSEFQRINEGFWKQIEKGQLTYEELMKIRWNTIFKEFGIDFDGPTFEEYFRNKLYTSAHHEPGAREILEYLSKKYVLCIAGNGPYDQQRNRLVVGEIIDYFSYVFISSKVGAQKPSSEFFDYCFDEIRRTKYPDLTPEETIMIGDSISADINGGKNYGMLTCLYRSGSITAEDEAAGADYIVSKLTEIKNIL